MPCTTPPRICSSTSCGLMMVPQSSTHQCFRSFTNPVSISTSRWLPWMPLVNAKGHAREFVEWQAFGAVGFVHHNAIADVEFLGFSLEDRGGHSEDIAAQRFAGLPSGFAANPGRARGPGPAAIGCVVSVAGNYPDFFQRYAERGRDALRDNGFGALPLLGDARVHNDRTLGVELYGRAIHRRDAGAADAVERSRRIC